MEISEGVSGVGISDGGNSGEIVRTRFPRFQKGEATAGRSGMKLFSSGNNSAVTEISVTSTHSPLRRHSAAISSTVSGTHTFTHGPTSVRGAKKKVSFFPSFFFSLFFF